MTSPAKVAVIAAKVSRVRAVHHEGTRLAYRILVRRRMKCTNARTHTIGYCRTCGVHQ